MSSGDLELYGNLELERNRIVASRLEARGHDWNARPDLFNQEVRAMHDQKHPVQIAFEAAERRCNPQFDHDQFAPPEAQQDEEMEP
jgi:hypothetical protein